MATLIPVEGELLQIAPPESFLGVDTLLSGSVPTYEREVWMSVYGEAFVCSKPHLGPVHKAYENPRAQIIMDTHKVGFLGGSRVRIGKVYGSVLYMSRHELLSLRKSEGPEPPRDINLTGALSKMVPIYGETFHLRTQLKKIGGKWNSKDRVWTVPRTSVAKALCLVEEDPRPEILRIANLFASATLVPLVYSIDEAGVAWIGDSSQIVDANYAHAENEYLLFLSKNTTPSTNNPLARKQRANGSIRPNKKNGNCHLCGVSVPAETGSLFFVGAAPLPGGGSSGGWTIECHPLNKEACATRQARP